MGRGRMLPGGECLVRSIGKPQALPSRALLGLCPLENKRPDSSDDGWTSVGLRLLNGRARRYSSVTCCCSVFLY